MPRKFDITEMKAKLTKYDERKRIQKRLYPR